MCSNEGIINIIALVSDDRRVLKIDIKDIRLAILRLIAANISKLPARCFANVYEDRVFRAKLPASNGIKCARSRSVGWL